jgi:hypothetical protein
MPEKSSSDFCCCNGCETKPDIWDTIGRDLVEISSWKKYCCSCIPEFAFVSIIDSDELSGGAVFKLWCSTTSDLGLEQPLYTKLQEGGILVGSVVIDLAFHIRIRDGQCILYILSEELGITEDTYGATKVIDAEARAAPNNFCSTLSNDNSSSGGSPYTEFSVGGYRIRIAAADHTPIRGRDHCYDENGVTVFDTDPIRDLCCNCNCICRCMCLSVTAPGFIFIDDEPASTYSSASVACIYNNTYSFANGMQVRIGPLDGLSNDNIISCWDMDEETGSRLDSFDLNNLQESTPIASGTGKILSAAEFDGSGFLFKEDDSTLQFFGMSGSICLWAKPTSLAGDMTIIGKTAGNGVPGFGWKIWYSQSLAQFVFSISNGTTIFSVLSPSAVSAGAWHFIAATIDDDSKTITIRVNNETIAVESYTGSVPATTAAFTIGGQDSVSTPEYFLGLIDQVSLWKDNLSADQLSSALWNNGDGRACEYDDRCYLIVTDMGPFTSSPPSPFLLDDEDNPCPRPTARWTFQEPATAEMPFEQPVFVSLRCASESQCTVDISACCPSGRTNFPSTLTADVQTGCYACPNISISLVWDENINEWIGYGDMCGHLITLSIGCGFSAIGFSATPCVIVPDPAGNIPLIGYPSCEPVLAVFSGPLSGIGCCGGSVMGINNITITVYE